MTNPASKQTVKSFADKWEYNPKLAFSTTLDTNSEIHNWILNRNGFANQAEFGSWLGSGTRVLDAGCGNGRVSALIQSVMSPTSQLISMDINPQTARENLKQYPRVEVIHGDLSRKIDDVGKFDRIYCQEVLHHTQNPFESFANLVEILNPDGEIAIYVYKRKAPVREFVDDLIRDKIANLSWAESLEEMQAITRLGQILSELKIEIEVPEIKSLEIPSGKYDIQRFLYNFFMKNFWSAELDTSENQAINADWYHPQVCSRHSMEEVLNWFSEVDLEVIHTHEDFYGITVHGKAVKKP